MKLTRTARNISTAQNHCFFDFGFHTIKTQPIKPAMIARMVIGDACYFHSRQRATPPKMPDSLETILMFGPGSKLIFLVLPPPM
jgi:hypothetical protein